MFTATNEIKTSKLFAFKINDDGTATVNIDQEQVVLTADETFALRDYLNDGCELAFTLKTQDQS